MFGFLLTPLELGCLAGFCIILAFVIVLLWPLDDAPIEPDFHYRNVRVLPNQHPYDWETDGEAS